MRIRLKFLAILPFFATTAICALADLELRVDTEYPRHLELKIPVQENSDFQIRTSFAGSEFFNATGHIDRVTGMGTNRSFNLTYGYEYDLGNSRGSAAGSQSGTLGSEYSVRVVSSIWAANPRFTIEEITPPRSPATWYSNAARSASEPVLNKVKGSTQPPLSVESFRFIQSTTTIKQVIARVGQPVARTGSGILIYEYRLGDGTHIWIGTADNSAIMYVRHGRDSLDDSEALYEQK